MIDIVIDGMYNSVTEHDFKNLMGAASEYWNTKFYSDARRNDTHNMRIDNDMCNLAARLNESVQIRAYVD